MESERTGLRALSEPEKVFMDFRKIWLANREDSRETSKFSVKNFAKTYPCAKRSANKNQVMVICKVQVLYFLHFLL